MTIEELPPLKETLKKYNLWPDKNFGQNFLLDLNITDKIARRASPLDQHTIIEIGPGPGGLTRSLLKAGAKKVIAVELDPRCIDALNELKQHVGERLEIIHYDALEINCASLGEEPRKIVANLPYNVATPLLIGWLKQINSFESLTLMFQKEVADRLKAAPRTPEYGRLSIITQKVAYVGHLFDLSPVAFFPPPKVVSTVVQLTSKPQMCSPELFKALETVTKVAFNQRRKMLRASLRALDLKDIGKTFQLLGISPTARPEELTVDDFTRLAECYLAEKS